MVDEKPVVCWIHSCVLPPIERFVAGESCRNAVADASNGRRAYVYAMLPSISGWSHSVSSCTVNECCPAMSLPVTVTDVAWPKLPGIVCRAYLRGTRVGHGVYGF